MKRLGVTVAKNVLANVVRGSASAAVALVLPHYLTHDLTVERYSAWVLMLQIAAWSNYLDFGLQTAVARYVAQAIERNDRKLRDSVISTALILLCAAGALALLLASVVVWKMPQLFSNAPHELLGELRGGVMVLSAVAALQLPLSTFTGILIGLHRNEYPAIAIGGSRLLGALGVLVLVRHTPSLVWLASCVGGFNLLGGALQYWFSRRLLPDMAIRFHAVARVMARELITYCTGLTAFSVGMLLVSGLDLTIVGYFAFDATGYYAIASTVITFLVGLSGSVFSAFLAPLAVLQERREYSRIRDIVLDSTRIGSYASLALIALAILTGKPLLTLWVGPQYAAQALPILVILLYAQALRLTGNAYTIALIATAQQNFAVLAALTEGITNLLASIIGARLLGPVGVAWGTFAGALFGILSVLFYTMRRVKEVPIHGVLFGRETIFRPLLCFLPLLLYMSLRERFHLSEATLVSALSLNIVLLFWIGKIPHISLGMRRFNPISIK